MGKIETNINDIISYKANYWLYIFMFAFPILYFVPLFIYAVSFSKYFLLAYAIYLLFHLCIISYFNHSIYLEKDALTIKNPIFRTSNSYLYSQIERIRLSHEIPDNLFNKGLWSFSTIIDFIRSIFWFYEPKSIYLYLHNGKRINKGCWSFEYDCYDNDDATRMDYLFHDLKRIHSDVKWTKNEDSYYQPSED